MIFKDVREAALQQWLTQTKRVRENETDNIEQSFECDWQTKYGTKAEEDDSHYSVYCSIGEWNTNMTDYLTDKRFDDFDLTAEADKDVLYRHYTRILLCTSEIITDFQDLVTAFRMGHIPTNNEIRDGKTISRNKLNTNLPPDTIQNMFTYINNISKHKINSVHICNHHLHLHFEETGVCGSENGITVAEVNSYISNNPTVPPARFADTIVVPKLAAIIDMIINCYNIVDGEFKANNPGYEALCGAYQGVSVRA